MTLIEPGGYSTDWGGSSAKHATALPAYDEVREQAANRPSRRGTPGDPVATRAAVLTLVDSDDPPLRVFFGATLSPRLHPDLLRRAVALACVAAGVLLLLRAV